MIPSVREIAAALYGAYRLAWLDRAAMAFFDTSTAGFWKSFFCAVLIAPIYLIIKAIAFSAYEDRTTVPDYAVVEAMAYIIKWLAFPVVMASLTPILGRAERFVGFVVAYNWASFWWMLIALPVAILAGLGALTPDIGIFVWLVAQLAVLAYAWAVIRVALDLPPFTCVSIVVLDVALSLFIEAIAESRYLPAVS